MFKQLIQFWTALTSYKLHGSFYWLLRLLRQKPACCILAATTDLGQSIRIPLPPPTMAVRGLVAHLEPERRSRGRKRSKAVSRSLMASHAEEHTEKTVKRGKLSSIQQARARVRAAPQGPGPPGRAPGTSAPKGRPVCPRLPRASRARWLPLPTLP